MSEYETQAALLEYPEKDFPLTLKAARQVANNSLLPFIGVTGTLKLSELQELYTRTFDLNPSCALEIGYHLFGENYKRGEFLANLREMETPFDLGQEQQLPDYLPVLLRLLTKLQDEELRGSLISECLIPGIEKMLSALNDSENPYRYLLGAVRDKLRSEPVTDSPLHSTTFTIRATLPVVTSAAME